MKLPSKVINQIERSTRNFLWKGKADNAAIIQVNWKKVYQKGENGGLGLLSLKAWNDVALTKLIDGILRGNESCGLTG